MNVAIFEVERWERDTFLRLAPQHRITFSPSALSAQTVGDHGDAEVVSPFVYSKLDAHVLRHLPKLRLIATRSTGYDHIDLDYCRAHGVVVCNVPDYGDSTVAEHAFALLLGIARNISVSVERTRRGVFNQSGLRGFELHGKTLGVIGTGRIGKRVIEIAKGFGMSVVAFDKRPDGAAASRLNFRYAALDEMLAIADVVSLHIPATAGAAQMISDREFDIMKHGAVLINTARGAIVDVPALVRALADGKLRAAGLDVLPQEPAIREEAEIFRDTPPPETYDLKALVANHVLLQFPNVVVTPHNAYNTNEAVHRIIDTTLNNIELFISGAPCNVIGSA